MWTRMFCNMRGSKYARQDNRGGWFDEKQNLSKKIPVRKAEATATKGRSRTLQPERGHCPVGCVRRSLSSDTGTSKVWPSNSDMTRTVFAPMLSGLGRIMAGPRSLRTGHRGERRAQHQGFPGARSQRREYLRRFEQRAFSHCFEGYR